MLTVALCFALVVLGVLAVVLTVIELSAELPDDVSCREDPRLSRLDRLDGVTGEAAGARRWR